MNIPILKKLFNRDLTRLRTEIELFKDESKLWHTEKQITNSSGNLCLHLIGNLNCYIGAELGKTNYIRNRPLEFSSKDISKEELIAKINATIEVVNSTLDTLNDEDLKKTYPILVLDELTTTAYFLFHLTTHLNYHLGQINYHRRLLDNINS